MNLTLAPADFLFAVQRPRPDFPLFVSRVSCPPSGRRRCRHSLSASTTRSFRRQLRPPLVLCVRFSRDAWTRSVHRSHSCPLHWARLRGNSCALRLRVFCFSVSSQKIFGKSAEVFLCPSRNADPRLGSSPHSHFSAPITRAENGETKSCMYMLSGIGRGCRSPADVRVIRA